MDNSYLNINKETWNQKTQVHIESDFYNNEAFLNGECTLKQIELDLLGNIEGKSILHLQCHFGQDSISLARRGAKVTAIDLSDVAIQRAQEFAEQLNVDVEFICSNIYDLPAILNKKFDIVFTSYGVISWLPDLDQWAEVISLYMKPKSRFIFVEFHPVVWMFDDNFEKVGYSYFNTGEQVETFEGTYADRNAPLQDETVNWNHSIADSLNGLIKSGIIIKSFNEFDYSPYNVFAHTIEIEKDKYRIKHLEDKIPMVFAIEGVK